ncbi:MAG: site-2 protease family protein [Betaproteobacteria bacterium]|nr:MAG: site-2 protease family protein [Betaproteobacteria bacterium]
MLKILSMLFAAGKLGKVLTTGGTMILSVFAYALVWGLPYAVGLVLLIFVHEMGHYLAARQRGLAVGAPTFIPFVGAWVAMKDMPHDVETEAYIGLAGPVVGTLGAMAVYWAAQLQSSSLLLAIAYGGFFINLFNLIPLSPFDGGRITAIISPRVWLIGVPILAGLFFWRPSPMLILMALLAAPQVLKAFRHDPRDPATQRYYAVPLAKRVQYGVWYLGLAAFLAIMTHELHETLVARGR